MPRHNGKRHKRKGTTNPAQAFAKAASDFVVKNGDPNPTPVGRPASAALQLLSPPTAPPKGSEKRRAAMAEGEDAGLLLGSDAKRFRPAKGALADEAAAECSPLQYVTVNEAEVRTAIKVLYVQTLDAPPESEWKGNDGTISFISNTLGVHRGTVHDVLLRCTAAEETAPRQHRRRQPGADAS